MLSASLDALARQDAEQAAAIKQADSAVDAGYDAILREQLAAMQEHPHNIEQRLSIIWAARSLERIGDHAKNIGEYVVYLVEGEGHPPPKAARRLKPPASGLSNLVGLLLAAGKRHLQQVVAAIENKRLPGHPSGTAKEVQNGLRHRVGGHGHPQGRVFSANGP